MFNLPVHPKKYSLTVYFFLLLIFAFACGAVAVDTHQINKMNTQLVSSLNKAERHRQYAKKIMAKQQAESARKKSDNVQSLAGLQALAHVWKDDIAIISLQQQSARHQIELSLDAKNLAAFLDFTYRLKPVVKEVNIIQHQEKKDNTWKINGAVNIGYVL